MLRMILFHLLLFASCGYALWKGSRDARIVAATCLIATFASVPIAAYGAVEINVVFVDMLVLASFLFVALQTDRFWPLWVAGLHVTTMVGHALMLLTGDMVPIAYAARPAKLLRTWDKFVIPWPFAKINFAIGEPFYPKKKMTDEEMALAQRELERRMHEAFKIAQREL